MSRPPTGGPALFGGLLACACSQGEPSAPPAAPAAPATPPWFEECALERGLDFVLESGHRERYLFPEIMCGGAALFDMDEDGDLDAYLVQGGTLDRPPEEQPGDRLYANRGDGTFEDVTEGSGVDDRGYGMGVATSDYDADGDVDLFVTNVGRDTLLRNESPGRFADVTAEAGVGDTGWGASSAFLDYDVDGDLDLFVVRYIYWSLADDMLCQGPPHGITYCSPLAYSAPAPSILYRNQGDGTFRDVSVEAGLRTSFGNGLGVVCSDFDGNGYPDVFVANDGTKNNLWMNRGDGSFEDAAVRMGCAVDQDGRTKAGMGVSAADVDDDGDEDVLVVNLDGESDSFYRNDVTHFSDRTPLVGLSLPSRPFTRFGVALADLDNDGWLDLYVANGRVVHPLEATDRADPFAEPDLLLRGSASGRFEEVSPRGGTLELLCHTGRGAAFGDVDGDGGIDVLVSNRDARAYLLRNAVPRRGHWLSLAVIGASGSHELGAVVTLRVGERRITRTVRSAFSYLSASDPRIHLGLGESTGVDEVVVRWVDGTLESFGACEADRRVALVRGGGTSTLR